MFFFSIFLCFRLHILGHPHVGSHDAAFSDGDSAQDGGVGIYDDVVFQDRVARDSLDRIAVLIQWETLGSEGDTLVELHVVADDAGGTDNHTRAMVDGEVVADGSLRIDIDTRLRVCQFRHHSWNEGHAELVQNMSDTVVG